MKSRRKICREVIGDKGICPSSITIALPTALSMKQQIAEVNRLLSEWLERLEEPFDDRLDGLYLTECRFRDRQRICCYEIFEKYPN